MSATATNTVQLGTSVKVRGLIPGEETTIRFVPESEANYFDHKLPPDSILGEALVGAEVSDKVAVDPFGDQMELEVLEVEIVEQ